jgi:putative ABC transport system permease protein
MNPVRGFVANVRELVANRAIEREMAEELRAHHDMLVDDYTRRGMTPAEARRRAAMTLGGLDQTKERVRDTRGFPSAEGFFKDLRHAVRLLVHAPGFSIVTILTLALGIGVNVAIFSLVDAVVLRPMPYPDPDRLISIWETSGSARGGAPTRGSVSPGNLGDYRKAGGFSGIAGLAARVRNLTGRAEPEALMSEEVTQNYFAVLGVTPAFGRTFSDEELLPSGRRAVVLSNAVWQRRFGGDPALLGQSILIDGQPHEVVGVMPAGFRGLTDFSSRDPVGLWLPAVYDAELLANRGDHQIRLVARLANGVSVESARSELSAISESLARDYPKTNERVRTGMQPLGDDVVRNVWISLVILFVTVALILTIACVNVANLLLARGVGRRREIAVRFALGATRFRVVTSLVTESLVLAGAASVVGLVLAIWIKNVLLAAAPPNIPRLAGVAIDGRVLLYTMVVGAITGLLFGIIPAWQAGHSRPIDALSGAGRSSAGAAVMRWRNGLMLAQIALSAILLVAAGLMIKSLYRLNNVALGFETDHVVAMRLMLPDARYATQDARFRFFDTLEQRVAALPGVQTVGFANNLPLRGGWGGGFGITGMPMPPSGYFAADMQAVSPGYFKTLGIRLERGRLLDASDTAAGQPVAVVSRLFEQRFLNGDNAIGRRIQRDPKAPEITIVGVVQDVRRDGKTTELEPQVYLPAAQTKIYPVRLSDIAIKTHGSPTDLLPAIRAAVWQVDPEQPLTNVRTLDDILLAGSADRRFQAVLFSMFALLALALASIGTYGVVSYVVSQRTPEIGVRMALGASVAQIYQWLLVKTAVVVLTGAVLGLIAARWLGQYVSTLLFQVTVGDVPSYALAAGILVTVALGASLLAGRRATRVNPTVALRYE